MLKISRLLHTFKQQISQSSPQKGYRVELFTLFLVMSKQTSLDILVMFIKKDGELG